MRIVVADAIAARLAYVRQVLVGLGHTIVAVGNDGIWAVTFCKKHTPDVALLDMSIGNMNAARVAAVLQRDKTAHYVVVTTGSIHEHGHAVNAGDVRSILVQKPMTAASFQAAISAIDRGTVLPALSAPVPSLQADTSKVPNLPYRSHRRLD